MSKESGLGNLPFPSPEIKNTGNTFLRQGGNRLFTRRGFLGMAAAATSSLVIPSLVRAQEISDPEVVLDETPVIDILPTVTDIPDPNNELLEAQIGRDPAGPELESFFIQIRDLEQNPNLTPVRYEAIQKLKTIIIAKGISMWNPLGINPAEALEFAKSNDKTIFPSFRVWNSPDGKDPIIIGTGPRPKGSAQGFGAVQGNIENLETALTQLVKLDPNFFKNYPVNAITGFTQVMEELGNAAGSFDVRIKTLFFSEVNDPYGPINVWQLMRRVLVEAWHTRYKGAPDKPDINLGVGKADFADNWIDAHASSFPPDIVRVWKDLNKQLRGFYAANPWLGE